MNTTNKRIILTLFIGLIYNISALAQTIRILDKSDLTPIPQVLIYCGQNKYSTTDINGIATLSDFTIGDTLSIQHSSFKKIKVVYNKTLCDKPILMTQSLINIEEVLISANKWEQNKQEISHKISAISKKEIEFNNPQTTADLLQAGGEVYVQKSQLGGGSPMIRGFATNSVLLVVDGVRLNNAIYRQGNLQNVITLDANIMDGSEVLFGPGSVIYGSDALGGVMDFHTRSSLLSATDKILFKVNALTRYSSANNEQTAHADFILANKKLSSVTSISFSKYEDLKMGTKGNNNNQYLRQFYVKRIENKDSICENTNKDVQKFSGYKQLNLMQKLRYKVNDNINLEYAFHYSQSSDIPRYDALRQIKKGKPKFARWDYGPQLWQMHALKTRLTNKNILYDDAKVLLAYQNYQESRITRKFNKSKERNQHENVDIASINIDFNKNLNSKLSIFYGGEFLFNGLKSEAETKDIKKDQLLDKWTTPRYPDGDNYYFSVAVYTGSKFKISEKILLNAGLRYSFVSLKSTFNNDYYKTFGFADTFTNKNGAINGSLGMAYRPSENTQLNLNASSGFQAPNWDGLGKLFNPKKGTIIIPNKNLKPQYAYNFEGGIIQYLFNKSVSIEASAFYTIVHNPIIQDKFQVNNKDSISYLGEMNAIEAFANSKNANIYGANLSVNANLVYGFGLKTFLTYTKGEDNNGQRLRHVPPMFAHSHLIYQYKKFKADFYYIYNSKVTDLPQSEQGKDYMYAINDNGELYSPEWFTLNMKMNYAITPMFHVSCGVENILDTRYRPYACGIASAGRNFIFSLRVRF